MCKDGIPCSDAADSDKLEKEQAAYLGELANERSYRTLCLLALDFVRASLMKGARTAFKDNELVESASLIAMKMDIDDGEQWLRSLPHAMCPNLLSTKSNALKENDELLKKLVGKYEKA